MHEKEQAVVVGDWCYSPDYGQLCQVIETRMLWGETPAGSGCRANAGLSYEC
ncbi:MAG: hypothetical protein XD74_1812 [Actinobacteria bacterium 66_15]|nr:MAG: hypothetical protein XD74_1812 [Actinobacteria bacterium 66_15]